MKQQSEVEGPAAEQSEMHRPLATPATSPRLWLASLSCGAPAILFVVAACLVCLGYTIYTNQTWEDALITLRHAENLLKGEGLTYNPGELVHGFTSPINVLLLALCQFLTGQSSYDATLWLYRVFSIAAFAASGVLMLKAFDETPPRWSAATWFLGFIYLFDVKNVAFSVNGMETAFMILFVAWAVYLMSRAEPERWFWRGLCWSGLMWSRPDGCVYIAALSLAELIFMSTLRRATIVSLAKSAAVCVVVYVPWFDWAWSYYGSPIPHTIIAKGNVEQGALSQLVATLDNVLMLTISMSAQVFRPIYFGDSPDWWLPGIWGRLIYGLTEVVGIVALLFFLCPVKDRLGRAMSFCFAIVCFYFAYMPSQYPWYFPPAMIFGAFAFTRAAIALAFAGEQVTAYLHLQQPRTTVLTAFVVLAAGALLEFCPACFEERVQQLEIEDGNRAMVGTWLKENGKPTDSVYLEPLGYIGYYSGMQMKDFPGLVSPEVVQIRRRLVADAESARAAKYLIPTKLKTDWVVLRRAEYENMARLGLLETFHKDYAMVKEFSVEDRLRQHEFLPGRNGLMNDSMFGIFRRNPNPTDK
jgi:hypothetical protein